VENNKTIDNIKVFEHFLTFFPEWEIYCIENYVSNSPVLFLESVTIRILDKIKEGESIDFSIKKWIDYFNSLSEFLENDELVELNNDLYHGVLYSIEYFYLSRINRKELQTNLKPVFKKMYEKWEEYYKD
jgi:hypothetical protein